MIKWYATRYIAFIVLLLFSLLVYSCNFAVKEDLESQKRILLDTDTNNEIDDQHALAYLLFNKDKFNIEGVTVNSTKEESVKLDSLEAQRILKLCKSEEIPLRMGADHSFNDIKSHVDSSSFEGDSAINFIIKKANSNSGQRLIILAIGKLTNIALAVKKEPNIVNKIRLVWLGSNYPESGEHNQVADIAAMNYLLNSDIPFEMVTVRYGKPSGTDAVKVSKAQILKRMAGKGPQTVNPVEGRHGGKFYNFGDYSINLFKNYQMDGDPPSRPLFDMAAVALVKNAKWADSKKIPAPIYTDGRWKQRPKNKRSITIRENFHTYAILSDFFSTMEDPSI